MRGLKTYKKQVLLFVCMAFAAYYISAFWYQLMLIQGQSMYPSYHDGQIVLLDKRFLHLKKGDVIAFYCEPLHTLLVKRIAAMPKDTVQIADGILYVNGLPDELAQKRGFISYAGTAQAGITLLEDEYFVMGDYYAQSKDSRYEQIGCISRKDIVGRVIP